MTSTTPKGSWVVQDRPAWASSDVCFRSGLIHFSRCSSASSISPITNPTSVRYASSRGLRRSAQSASKILESPPGDRTLGARYVGSASGPPMLSFSGRPRCLLIDCIMTFCSGERWTISSRRSSCS